MITTTAIISPLIADVTSDSIAFPRGHIRNDLPTRRKLVRREAREERSGRESPQYIDRIDRNARKERIYAVYPRSIICTGIDRKSVLIDRNLKYRPQYRPRSNTLMCRSFILCSPVAVDAVGILRSFTVSVW